MRENLTRPLTTAVLDLSSTSKVLPTFVALVEDNRARKNRIVKRARNARNLSHETWTGGGC